VRYRFDQWAPDRPQFAQGLLRDAKNVIPEAGGYQPMPAPVTLSTGLASRPRGLVAARGGDGLIRYFCGDGTKLYRLINTTWVDASRTTGGAYAATETTRWRWTTFGDQLLATNWDSAVQRNDMSTLGPFRDLGGSPPRARYIASYLDFILLGHTSVSALEVIWSGSNNTEIWTSGVYQSDRQVLPDGGYINGLAVSDAAYILQEQCIRRMLYEGGGTVMRFDVVERARGCAEGSSIVQQGRMTYYLSEDGWQAFDGLQSTPIGLERVDEWFKGGSTRGYWYRMSGAIDPVNKLIGWLFASPASTLGAPDTMLIYNWGIDRWAYAKLSLEILTSVPTQGVTLEELDALAAPFGGVEYYPISPDDPVLSGGALRMGGALADGSLAYFTGAALEATIETDDWPISEGLLAFVTGVRPLTEARAYARIGVRTTPFDPVTWKGETQAHAKTGLCGARATGRFVRAKVRIPAGATWSHAQGVEIELQGAGAR
jgi:hypothetical protein